VSISTRPIPATHRVPGRRSRSASRRGQCTRWCGRLPPTPSASISSRSTTATTVRLRHSARSCCERSSTPTTQR